MKRAAPLFTTVRAGSLLLAVWWSVATPPVMAQESVFPGFLGFAAAQAPEAGLGACHGTDQAETTACAQAECVAQSGLTTEDCAVNLWCYPAFWVADIFMQHAEGPHWHEFVCDNTRQAAEAVAAIKCSAAYLVECLIVRLWDEEGELVLGE